MKLLTDGSRRQMYYLYYNNKFNLPVLTEMGPVVDIKLVFNKNGGAGRQKNEKESEIGGFAA
jgi:hypothetical protein